MKKSLIFLGMLSIGYAYAQQGNVGINTITPKATLDIQPNADNAKVEAKTNQGIIAPRLSKTRVANIETPVQGTLVYVLDENSTEYPNSLISAYTGNDSKVAKITEKGYYFYNGTEWVKTSATDGGEWKYDGVDAIVAKRANETTAQDLIQIKNGKGLQQFIGSPDATTLTYNGYSSISQQVVPRSVFKPNADLKSVPNFKYITSDALESSTSLFENPGTFVSDYKLFQLKQSHLDKVTEDRITYRPYVNAAHFDNVNKKITDIWLNRGQLFLGDKNTAEITNIGGYELSSTVSGSNNIGTIRGLDSNLYLTGSNTINAINGVRSFIENTHGFTGNINNVYGGRSVIKYRNRGEVKNTYGYTIDIEVPATSNAVAQNVYAYNTGIDYLSQNTTPISNIITNHSHINVNSAGAVKDVKGFHSTINIDSEVNTSLSSLWLANNFANTKTTTLLNRMDGVVVSNKHLASAPISYYSGIVVHNTVEETAKGNVENMFGVTINNDLKANATAEVKNNYGLYISNVENGKEKNYAIHTAKGQVRVGDLAQTGAGDRVVYADENGVLKTGSANTGVKANTTAETCSDANLGAIHFKEVEISGTSPVQKKGVFGFCTKQNDTAMWVYLSNGGNIMQGTGTFGQGL